jgi:DNA-binding protein HU-beta
MADRLTRRELVARIALYTELPRPLVARAVKGLVDVITDSLRTNRHVDLRGLGVFELRKVTQGTRLHPRTRQPVASKSGLRPAFRAGRRLRSALQQPRSTLTRSL